MKKLKLNLDQIKVNSFNAGEESRGGTVHAHSWYYQCHTGYTACTSCTGYTGVMDSCYSCPAPPECVPQDSC